MAKPMMSTRRRLTIATWKPPHEGVIFGKLTLDCTDVLAYIEDARERTGSKVTITSFIGAAVGRALAAEPTLNGRISMGKYYPYDDVSLSFLVQIGGGKNLAQVRVQDIDKMSPAQVADKLAEKADTVRTGGDENFNKSTNMASKMPTWMLRRVLSLAGFMTTGLGKEFAGQPAFPFGACIITSVGMLGVDEALIPPTPFARVPLYVGIGAIRDMVFAIDGQPVVRPGITVTATMDHRFVDGFQAATVSKVFRECFENPGILDVPAASDSVEGAGETTAAAVEAPKDAAAS